MCVLNFACCNSLKNSSCGGCSFSARTNSVLSSEDHAGEVLCDWTIFIRAFGSNPYSVYFNSEQRGSSDGGQWGTFLRHSSQGHLPNATGAVAALWGSHVHADHMSMHITSKLKKSTPEWLLWENYLLAIRTAQKCSFQNHLKDKMWSEKRMKCGSFAQWKFVSKFSGYSGKTVQLPAEQDGIIWSNVNHLGKCFLLFKIQSRGRLVVFQWRNFIWCSSALKWLPATWMVTGKQNMHRMEQSISGHIRLAGWLLSISRHL